MGRSRVTKPRCVSRRAWRKRQQRAEPVVVLIVVFDDREVLVGKLRLKVERGCVGKATHEWSPIAAVGPDGPKTPDALVAQSLGFVTGKHDATIFQDCRMQRAAQVQMANLLDVFSIIIHHEQLQIWECVVFVRKKAIPAGSEHHTAVW